MKRYETVTQIANILHTTNLRVMNIARALKITISKQNGKNCIDTRDIPRISEVKHLQKISGINFKMLSLMSNNLIDRLVLLSNSNF